MECYCFAICAGLAVVTRNVLLVQNTTAVGLRVSIFVSPDVFGPAWHCRNLKSRNSSYQLLATLLSKNLNKPGSSRSSPSLGRSKACKNPCADRIADVESLSVRGDVLRLLSPDVLLVYTRYSKLHFKPSLAFPLEELEGLESSQALHISSTNIL